jgi:hypothetical protein
LILLYWPELVLQVGDIEQGALIDNTDSYIALFTAILVIVTAILAAITGYYATQTRKSVIALEESTRAQLKPFLKASIVHLGPEDIAIKINNVGKGSAERIRIEFAIKVKSSIVKRIWEQELMAPNDFQTYFVPKSENETETGIKFFGTSESTVGIIWTCRDILGASHEGRAFLNLTEYARQLERPFGVYQEEPITKIAREIVKIEDILSKIEKHLKKG